MTLFTLLFCTIGLVVIGLAVPLVFRRIPPNHLYGLRVRATFADEWVWYEANARSGRDLLVLGVIQLACALLLREILLDTNLYALINGALLAAAAIALATLGWHRANTLLELRRRSQ